MTPKRPGLALPEVLLSNSTQESLQSCVSDSDIRPLLSPIVSEPDEHTTQSKLLITPGDDEDDLLLRSLKFASQSTANLKPQNSKLSLVSSKSSFRMYRDNPTDPTTFGSPYIFHPSGSKIINSITSARAHASNTHLALPVPSGDESDVVSRHSSIAADILSEVEHLKELTIEQLKRRRFFAISIFSIFCMFIFDLVFLPRTTLDRDLRRLYGGSLTHDEVSRIFISQLHANSQMRTYAHLYDEITHEPGKHHRFVENFLNSFEYVDVNVEKYNVYMGEPISTKIELVNTESNEIIFESNLTESENHHFTPSHFPYSANGTIDGQFLYVNYGSPIDYKLLNDSGIQMRGKIFIIRNGGSEGVHSSILIQEAERRGALGVVFYSDPYDDGKFRVVDGYKSFPLGPARNAASVEKQTGNFIYMQPGDPTTPGWSPYLFDDYKRLEDPDSVPKIPVLPISVKDIEPILSQINDIGPHFNWGGDLRGFKYTPGPSSDKYILRMINHIDYGIKPIYNIISEIPGSMTDEEIIIGTSRDTIGGLGGFSNGEMGLWEIIRGFNELVKRGWKPLRTIKLISWDGSSYGQLGSTEYGEYHAQRLINNCVVYINFDQIRGSRLNFQANPMFHQLLRKVMDVVMVHDKDTLSDFFQLQNNTVGMIDNDVKDYTIFQNHLGVSSINIGTVVDLESDPVIYHNSQFDNLTLLQKYDPDLKLHNLLAQFIGMLTIELSEHEIIGVSVSEYMRVIRDAFVGVSSQIPDEWLRRNMTYPFNDRLLEQEVKDLEKLIGEVSQSSKFFDMQLQELQHQILEDYPWFKLFKKVKTAIRIKLYNTKVKALDKMFLHIVANEKESMMPERPWFRHLVFAPSTVGNAAVLPGLHDALAHGDFERLERNLLALHVTLARVSEGLA